MQIFFFVLLIIQVKHILFMPIYFIPLHMRDVMMCEFSCSDVDATFVVFLMGHRHSPI